MQVAHLDLATSREGRVDTQAGHRATDQENLASFLVWRDARRARLIRQGQDPQIDIVFRKRESSDQTTLTVKCGTPQGYFYHTRHKEPSCQPCKDAYAARDRERQRAKRKSLKPCGTNAAHARHIANSEEPCGACKRARSEYLWQRQVAERGTVKRAKVAACGTPSGYSKHIRNSETPCEECRMANSTANRARRRKKREAKAA